MAGPLAARADPGAAGPAEAQPVQATRYLTRAPAREYHTRGALPPKAIPRGWMLAFRPERAQAVTPAFAPRTIISSPAVPPPGESHLPRARSYPAGEEIGSVNGLLHGGPATGWARTRRSHAGRCSNAGKTWSISVSA